MKMAYVAIDQKTNDCYAITSADPDFIVNTIKEIARLKRDGAIIKLLPADEANRLFCDSLAKEM